MFGLGKKINNILESIKEILSLLRDMQKAMSGLEIKDGDIRKLTHVRISLTSKGIQKYKELSSTVDKEDYCYSLLRELYGEECHTYIYKVQGMGIQQNFGIRYLLEGFFYVISTSDLYDIEHIYDHKKLWTGQIEKF